MKSIIMNFVVMKLVFLSQEVSKSQPQKKGSSE